MGRVFFLSHSSDDKEIVRQVWERLGKRRCWFDEGEIKPGESLIDRIDTGIADSRIFVLFWSQRSAESAWVKEEVSQARLRALRDRGYRLVTVKLDSTPLPDALSVRLYIDIGSDADRIADELERSAEDLALSGPNDLFVDSFQNRDDELTRLEAVANDPEVAGALIVGLPGMGKSALVRRAVSTLFPQLLPIWIDLDASGTPVRLLANIARPLSLSVDLDVLAADPRAFWRSRLLPEVAAAERTVVVVDSVGSTRSHHRGPATDDLVETIIVDLARISRRDNPGLIVIASTTPPLPESTLSRLEHIVVRSLEEPYMIRALRAHLHRTAPDHSYDHDELRTLAAALRGYPLALGLAAAQVAQKGLRLVVQDIQYIHELLIGLASELIAGIPISEDERRALAILAIANRPLDHQQITRVLGGLAGTTRTLAEKQLLDLNPDGLVLHGIVQEYVRERLAKPDELRRAHKRLATIYREKWEASAKSSAAAAEYGSLATYHSLAAGERNTESVSHVFLEEYKEAAIDMYRQRQYDLALKYLERIRAMPNSDEPTIRFYYALTLSRTGRPDAALPFLRDLATDFPNTSRYHHALGTAYRRLGQREKAIVSFRRAAACATDHDTAAMVSLAQTLIDANKPNDAMSYAQRAYRRDPSDSNVIATLASVHHAVGDNRAAVELLQDALRRRRNDTRLHVRAGMIAKSMGDLTSAENHLRRATSDANLPHAITALADVYIELGRYREAERTLERFPRDEMYAEATYWSIKANLLRRTRRLELAQEAAERAVRLEPNNAVTHGGLAFVHLEIARAAAQRGDREAASFSIELGMKAVRQGLAVDPDDAALLNARAALALLETPPPHPST